MRKQGLRRRQQAPWDAVAHGEAGRGGGAQRIAEEEVHRGYDIFVEEEASTGGGT
jgi:hypothetical protein